MNIINYKNVDVGKLSIHGCEKKYNIRYDKNFFFLKIPKAILSEDISKIESGKYNIQICFDPKHGDKSRQFIEKLTEINQQLVYLFDIIGKHTNSILESNNNKYYINLHVIKKEDDPNNTKFYDKLGSELSYKHYKSLLKNGRIVSSIIYLNYIHFDDCNIPHIHINLFESIIFDELLYNNHKIELNYLNI